MRRLPIVVPVLFLLCTALPLSAQRFGGSVAVVGDQVFVGETQNQILPGLVYRYVRANGSWVEAGSLMATESGPPDGFGRALASDAGRLFVGAPGHEDGQGAVFVYTAVGDRWTETGRISAGMRSPGDAFGTAVAVQGDLALVSAPGDREGTGAVYAFRRSPDGAWTEESKITAPEGQTGAAFGTTLALDGATALVGSPDQRTTAGAVYAFGRSSTGAWAPQGRLASPTGDERIGYGSSLAVRDGLALIGAPGMAQRQGSVFTFRWDGGAGEWTSDGTLEPFHASQRAQFGASIAFEGSVVWVGAPGDGDGAGAFYRFDRDGAGQWTGSNRMASTLEGAAGFASTWALAGNVGVAGAQGIDGRAGGAMIMEKTPAGVWTEAGLVVGDQRSFAAIAGDEVPCDENRAAAFECSEVNVVAFLPIKELGGARGTSVNDIWGWTDPESGREIAIVGRTDGTSFVDISDPSHPTLLGDLPKTEGSRSSIWRDMKVYQDHVYIVADAANEHGMQVFDLRQLPDRTGIPKTLEPTFTYNDIHSAHNIVIDEDAGFAYAVGSSSGGTTCGGGLHMINLEDPAHPTFAGCFADPNTGRSGTGYSHDAQCVIYHGPDTEHVGRQICLGSNETHLSISDVTDKDNPIALASISYPNVAYTHQGWLSEDQRYFYQNDEGDEPQGLVAGTRTLVWDLEDLDDPVLVKEYIATTTETDHNLYIRDNLMYQSNYGAGLRILDISVPTEPVEIAFFDTTPYGGGGSWSNYPFFESGLVIATSMGDGLFILKNTGRRHLIP